MDNQKDLQIQTEGKEEYYQRNQQTQHTDNKWKVLLWNFVYQYIFRTSPKFMKGYRNWILRCFGAKIAKKCYVSPYAIITRPWEFEMGYYSGVDDNCYIIPPVKIGDRCAIGNNCHLIAGGHDVFSRGFEQEFKPIEIGHCAFLGCGVHVAMGCKIGQMSVVASHVNVQKNIPENKVVNQMNGKLIMIDRLSEEEYKKYRYNH